MKKNIANVEHRILAPVEDSMRKIVRLAIPLDRSGSMAIRREEVFGAIHTLLSVLKKENLENVEVEYRVRLALFNEKVTELTTTALLPEDVAELFGEEEYVCNGLTGIATLYNYLDTNFSRASGAFLDGLRSGDALPMLLLVTDMEATDSNEVLAAAQEKLMKNKFFAASKRIVMFVGTSETKKKAAAALAGGEENVICVTSNVKEHLAALLVSATLIHSDSTHISNASTTPEEMGKDLRKKLEAGKESQDQLRDKKLEKELEEFLSGKKELTDEELEAAMEKYLAS